jgi:hypothetical protein
MAGGAARGRDAPGVRGASVSLVVKVRVLVSAVTP